MAFSRPHFYMHTRMRQAVYENVYVSMCMSGIGVDIAWHAETIQQLAEKVAFVEFIG